MEFPIVENWVEGRVDELHILYAYKTKMYLNYFYELNNKQ